jgi:hypothetical protein
MNRRRKESANQGTLQVLSRLQPTENTILFEVKVISIIKSYLSFFW